MHFQEGRKLYCSNLVDLNQVEEKVKYLVIHGVSPTLELSGKPNRHQLRAYLKLSGDKLACMIYSNWKSGVPTHILPTADLSAL